MTRWPLPWPEVRPSHLYLGTRNNSFFFFFCVSFQLLECPGAEDGRRARAQNFQPTEVPRHRSGSSLEGRIWENPGPGLHGSAQTRKAAPGSSPGRHPPSPNKGKRSLSGTGGKAHFWRESTSVDTLAFPNRFLYFRARFGDSSAFIPRLNSGN